VRSLRKYRFVREADGCCSRAGDGLGVRGRDDRQPRNIPDEVAGVFVLVPPDQEP